MKMTRHQLARLLHAPQDLDYVDRFQELQTLNLEMRKSGPTTEQLLRKALLEMEVGNFVAGLAAAKDAQVLAPSNAECHFQVGKAYVFLALAKADGNPLGPSLKLLPGESATGLVMKAAEAFRACLAQNPGDEEVQRDLDLLDELLAECDDEASLMKELRLHGL